MRQNIGHRNLCQKDQQPSCLQVQFTQNHWNTEPDANVYFYIKDLAVN